jgi:23S rRNA A1618 N6-methylase RlmF
MKPHSSSIKHTQNEQLHPKNPYYCHRPSFASLASRYPDTFGAFVSSTGKVNWKDPRAVKAVTQILLWNDFHIQYDFPEQYLCPPLPNRINYLCWLHDLIEVTSSLSMATHVVLDIGVGANCVYPMLGTSLFKWNFFGSDINAEAIQWAQQQLQRNPSIASFIALKHVPSSENLQTIITNHYLPQFQPKKSNDSSSVLYTPFCQYMKTVDIAQLRGPIRQSFASIGGSHQYRLMDCEYYYTSTILNPSKSSRMEENDRSKRSRGSKFYDDEEDGKMETSDTITETTNKMKYQPILTAVMTNPPFYDLLEAVQENEHSHCTGNNVEMKTIGGEVAFITAMIIDSLLLRERYALNRIHICANHVICNLCTYI